MPVSSELLEILEYVSASKAPLGELAQEHIAEAASAAKSNAGDRVLVQLVRREDLAPKARRVIEASPRAAAKAAWLSRTDHPAGYVEAAIDKEKRVTVLAAVAAHPDASDELIEALSRARRTKVSEAILGRDAAPDAALVNACASILDLGASMNYKQSYIASRVLLERAELLEDIVNSITSNAGLWAVADNTNIALPPDSIGRVVKAITANWEQDLPQDRQRWSSPVHRYSRAVSHLLSNPHWDSTRKGDALMAELIERITSLGGSVSDEAKLCLVRNKGTEHERANALAEVEKRKAAVQAARETTDEDAIVRYLLSNKEQMKDAVSENPNVTLECLITAASSGGVWLAQRHIEAITKTCLDRGDNPAHVAAVILLMGARTYDRLPEQVKSMLGGEDQLNVGRHLAQAMVDNTWARSSGLAVLRSMSDQPGVVAGALPVLSLVELHSALSHEYTRSEVKDAVAEHVANVLNDGLTSAEAWKTFVALAEQGQDSLERTVQVASLV